MSRLSDSRLLRALLAVLVVAPVVAAGTVPLTDEQARVFHSGDTDRDPEDVDGDVEDPTVYAKVADVAYRTTKPEFEVDDTTLLEHQRQSLAALDTGIRESRTLPMSSPEDSTIIKDAHVTFLGVHGGAKPRLGTGLAGGVTADYPTFVGESGLVLNHADYRVKPGVPQDDYCTDPTFETRMVDADGDGEKDTEILVDGAKTCYEFELFTTVDREVSFGEGETFDTDADVIPYSGLDSNAEQSLTVTADIGVRVERTTIDMDWTPDPEVDFPTDPSDGTWREVGSSVDPRYKTDGVTVSDETQVLVTDAGSLDISETVIEEDDDTKHVVLAFDGPRSGDAVTRDQLLNRLLWSYVVLDDERYISGTWRTYSVRQYERSFLHTADGRAEESDPPSVPRVYLIGMDRQPSVSSVGAGPTSTNVIGFEGYDVQTSQSVQSGVSLDPVTPLAYSRLVIANAPSAVDSVVSIHGTEVPVDDVDRVEYRTPEITITAIGEKRLRIHVEDPRTGAPLSGRRVYLYGADPQTTTPGGYAVTDGDGDLVVTRTNPFVRARTERDDWQDPSGDVFYDQATATATFLPDVLLLQRLYDLVFAVVVFSPLVLLYFYVRHFGFFE